MAFETLHFHFQDFVKPLIMIHRPSEVAMRSKEHRTTGSGDLFRARLDQIITMKHGVVRLAGKIDWDWIDGEIAPLYSENGRPGIATGFMIGCCSSTFMAFPIGGCASVGPRPAFQFFTSEEFLQHAFRTSAHWRKRLGDKLELLLTESLRVAQPI
ncbi:hypothetical protein ABIF65_007410 [Bradyrhizobium japonicum]|nr:IS5 family transposase [Bradyrhizobium japonicum]MCP1863367.1 IS5 family transposase [Bradyrhizobium japonicum]MCP1894221.1 IS5 family transposase [Bradyrhizobium japonicum]MCW2327338.1 IS5 family transposase [Bradyrhizobium japonicum]